MNQRTQPNPAQFAGPQTSAAGQHGFGRHNRIIKKLRIADNADMHRNHAVWTGWTGICLLAVWLSACGPSANRPQVDLTPQPPAASPSPSETPPPTATAEPSTTATIDATGTAQFLNIAYEQSALNLDAVSALVMDAQTGQVLVEKNARQRMYPASTTKIMTALLALEYFSLDETLLVGEEVNQSWTKLRINAQKAGLEYGQEISVKDLLHGLLLMSGSDAAFVLAFNTALRASGGSFASVEEGVGYFSAMMNERARQLGAMDTNFVNPDGFHDPNHYSTAYDLAVISQAAMQNGIFRSIVQTPLYRSAELVFDNGSYPLHWQNTNRLLDVHDVHYYTPANGIKTGTTPEAGSCLVSSATFDGRLVIAVVLDANMESVWTDSIRLLEYARTTLLPGS